jgi:predicted nucleic acid-binding protein
VSGFLLDTNVPSELIRKKPHPLVSAWFNQQPDGDLFISVMSIGEVRRGAELLANGGQRANLEHWLERILIPTFRGRILSVNRSIAERWAVLDAKAKLAGRPMNTVDGLIAATALENNLTLVTRNTSDFTGLALSILNPWNG